VEGTPGGGVTFRVEIRDADAVEKGDD